MNALIVNPSTCHVRHNMEMFGRHISLSIALVSAIVGTLLCVPNAYAGRFEAGSFTAHATNGGNSTPNFISFQQAFDAAPIVVALSDNSGPDAAVIRITGVTTAGFNELILESDSFDGPHAAQNIHYIAVEPGRHVLPGGQVVEAGRITTSAVQHGAGVAGPRSWSTVNFSSALLATSTVVTQIQTANSETRTVASQTSQPFISAVTRNLSATGFQVALERSEVSGGPIPSSETIGWIAFPANLTDTFPSTSGSTIRWSSVNTANNIRGWDNGCFVNGFGQTSATAIVVAKKMTRNGGDGGWLRRCSLSGTQVGLTVDEDTSRDGERAHTDEQASIIAFSSAFHANLRADISVTKTSLSFADPLGSDFAIPDATLDYLITVTNSGNAPPNYGTVIVSDALPTNLALSVADFGGVGVGPVQYVDGTPASGLGYNFVNLANTTDSIAFSTDGTNFNYTPTPDGSGFDSAVTHFQIIPSNFMEGDRGTGPTSFTLRLRAKID